MSRQVLVRPPAVAGAFYPGAPDALDRTVRNMLAGVDPARDAARALRALVVPHAGYVYSGPVAASAYRQVDPASVRRVILLGPSHRSPLAGLGLSSADVFATPMGPVEVDVEARRVLLTRELATIDDDAHHLEHSLEVQLPFLQRVLPGVPVLPVAVGRARAEDVADAIDALWDPDTLVVVSTDLSHYEGYESARVHDARTAAAVTALEPDAIDDLDACGAFALRGLLYATRRHGFAIRLLDLRSSGDTAGDRDRVVGYGAFVVEEAA